MAGIPVAIIDDDSDLLSVLVRFLHRHGISADVYTDPRKAVVAFHERKYGVIISDVQMPGMSGHEVLEHARAQLPESVVIMITGFGSVSSAVQAMKNGAFDYVSKPFDYDEFLVVVQKAIQQYTLQREVVELRRDAQARTAIGTIIGKGAAMRRVFDIIERVSATRTNVLIIGESGTGKELIARAVHNASPRRSSPFLAINCGALPETLLESELFGHERGAYTGAVSRERGLLSSADTGTVFLDEIADMPLSMQTKLLRVLEDWEIRPVGGNAVQKIDVRVISSSKTDLAARVRDGAFREDLFYRLNVVTIPLPPLRERPEDIPALIEHFLTRYVAEHGATFPVISRDAMDALLQYPWPGNVRELEHVMERAMILSVGEEIAVTDLPPHVVAQAVHGRSGALTADAPVSLEEVERAHIVRILRQVRWKRSVAAEMLGINRRTLYRKIRAYHIEEE